MSDIRQGVPKIHSQKLIVNLSNARGELILRRQRLVYLTTSTERCCRHENFTAKGRFTHSMPFTCRAHTVPLPCRAAKGLERVFPILFTQCGRVLFTPAMLRPCRSSQGHSTTRPSLGGRAVSS
jgi:hypothetical protein